MFLNIITWGISHNSSTIDNNCNNFKFFGSDFKSQMKENQIHVGVFKDLTVLISLLTSVSKEQSFLSYLTEQV
jgi:hypothetical protein